MVNIPDYQSQFLKNRNFNKTLILLILKLELKPEIRIGYHHHLLCRILSKKKWVLGSRLGNKEKVVERSRL